MTPRNALAVLILCTVLATGGWARAGSASRPDLEGTWSANFATPMERDSDDFKTVRVSEAEARAWERRFPDIRTYEAELVRRRPSYNIGLGPDPDFQEVSMRLMRIDGEARSAVIVDPPDGQLPWSDAGKARAADARRSARRRDNPEAFNTLDRCLTGAVQGPPLSPGGVKAVVQIVQTTDTVVLLAEEGDELRLVRLHAAHDPPALHTWGGDSIGWYDGDTLVVETTNFHPEQSLRIGSSVYLLSPDARVTERFRRTATGELRYSYEVVDLSNYTRPWRGEAAFERLDKPPIEDACHEGNYDLPLILAGARHEEAVARTAMQAIAQALEPPR